MWEKMLQTIWASVYTPPSTGSGQIQGPLFKEGLPLLVGDGSVDGHGDVANGDGCYCDGTSCQGGCPTKLSRCSAGKRGGSLSDVQRATMVHQSIPTLTPLSGLGLGLLVGKGEK